MWLLKAGENFVIFYRDVETWREPNVFVSANWRPNVELLPPRNLENNTVCYRPYRSVASNVRNKKRTCSLQTKLVFMKLVPVSTARCHFPIRTWPPSAEDFCFDFCCVAPILKEQQLTPSWRDHFSTFGLPSGPHRHHLDPSKSSRDSKAASKM